MDSFASQGLVKGPIGPGVVFRFNLPPLPPLPRFSAPQQVRLAGGGTALLR
jgi:hypothetical protein